MSDAPRIEIRIDRLMVDGVDAHPHHARRIHAALESELSALFSAEATAARLSGGSIPAMRAPDLGHANCGSPGDLGRAIARSVYAMISQKP